LHGVSGVYKPLLLRHAEMCIIERVQGAAI
jgi:hypothetical protein